MQAQRTSNRNTTNAIVDTVIFLAFLVAGAPHFSGLAIHEWLGISFGAAIITHLLLHWQWVVGVTKRFFTKLPRQTRLNYLVNTLLFIDITAIIFSGLMISKVALPWLGVSLGSGGGWLTVHKLAADGSLALVGAHVALHWQWIVQMARRLTGAQRQQLPAQGVPAASAQIQQEA